MTADRRRTLDRVRFLAFVSRTVEEATRAEHHQGRIRLRYHLMTLAGATLIVPGWAAFWLS